MGETKQYIKQYASLLDVDKEKEAKHKAELKVTESGGSIEIDNIGPRDFIISQLYLLDLSLRISKIRLREKNKRLAEIDRALEFIRNNIETIHYNKAGKDLKNIQYTFGLYPGVKEKNPGYNKELEDIFLTPGSPVRYIVSYSLFGENVIKKGAEVEKKGKFRRSSHLTDQILKYNYPKDRQPSLFDSLQSETIKDIELAGVEVSEIVEGIKLSPSETKVIDCLCKLLHETSQNLNEKREDYYSGNGGYELVEYGGNKNTPAPKIAFTLYELTKEYKGGDYVAGKDIENVKQILTELDSKRFLLSYVETTKKKDGGRIERKIEDFRKLIHIIKISQTEYSKEDIELSKKEETVILLNPIFRRQIDSKFIISPSDINRRTIIAYGSHNISEAALRLRDYLMRELSSKHYEPEIRLDKLYYLLAEKMMRESRKKKVKEFTDRALQTVKALGLLQSHEIKTASTGELKIVFKLNKAWE
jgi:hypothetical protein